MQAVALSCCSGGRHLRDGRKKAASLHTLQSLCRHTRWLAPSEVEAAWEREEALTVHMPTPDQTTNQGSSWLATGCTLKRALPMRSVDAARRETEAGAPAPALPGPAAQRQDRTPGRPAAGSAHPPRAPACRAARRPAARGARAGTHAAGSAPWPRLAWPSSAARPCRAQVANLATPGAPVAQHVAVSHAWYMLRTCLRRKCASMGLRKSAGRCTAAAATAGCARVWVQPAGCPALRASLRRTASLSTLAPCTSWLLPYARAALRPRCGGEVCRAKLRVRAHTLKSLTVPAQAHLRTVAYTLAVGQSFI
jgi:hypothetical protein